MNVIYKRDGSFEPTDDEARRLADNLGKDWPGCFRSFVSAARDFLVYFRCMGVQFVPFNLSGVSYSVSVASFDVDISGTRVILYGKEGIIIEVEEGDRSGAGTIQSPSVAKAAWFLSNLSRIKDAVDTKEKEDLCGFLQGVQDYEKQEGGNDNG